MTVRRHQVCTCCGIEKAHTLRNFYRCKTGRHGMRIKCKACVRKDIYENRALKADYYRAYDRERNRSPERRAVIGAWKRTPDGRESNRLSSRIYVKFRALEARA